MHQPSSATPKSKTHKCRPRSPKNPQLTHPRLGPQPHPPGVGLMGWEATACLPSHSQNQCPWTTRGCSPGLRSETGQHQSVKMRALPGGTWTIEQHVLALGGHPPPLRVHVAPSAVAAIHIKTDSIGLQLQAECWDEQQELTQLPFSSTIGAQPRHVTLPDTKTAVREKQENDDQTGSLAWTSQCLRKGVGGMY